jgi:hypothetical protein
MSQIGKYLSFPLIEGSCITTISLRPFRTYTFGIICTDAESKEMCARAQVEECKDKHIIREFLGCSSGSSKLWLFIA